ncbi:MAG: hypothetical protein ROO76_18510 [Terriglobia bacterium]|jgi:ElaB/YqjD/DUF883 family membrane-anchored ribosome-binding protein|nr:hypothetical protein [Terriglobia bacterium]
MRQTVLERTSEQIADTVGKAARATGSIGSALHDRYDEAKQLARRGTHRAEELFDESKLHIKRHPVAAVAGSFSLGLGIGILLGWTLRRK